LAGLAPGPCTTRPELPATTHGATVRKNWSMSPSDASDPASVGPPSAMITFPASAVTTAGRSTHALADAEVRHTRRRGVGVLRQHQGRPTGIEEPHVARGLGPVRDHVDLQMRLRRWPVLLRVDGADADEHGIGVVAQRAEDLVVDAVAETSRQSRHLARAIGRRDHVQADERPVGRPVVRECDMARHQLFGRRTVLGVEDAHTRTLAGVPR